MQDGWPDVVMKIYVEAVKELDGYEDPLEYGPSHIVWSDENFEDENIDFCLGLCQSKRQEYVDYYGEKALEVIRRSLEKLRAVPEEIRLAGLDDSD